MWRIVVAAVLIASVLVAAKSGRVLHDAGLTGSCSAVAAPAGQRGVWEACKRGRLDGRPDLTRQGCTASAPQGVFQVWRCPARIGSAAGA